jgi:hypothetical protein
MTPKINNKFQPEQNCSLFYRGFLKKEPFGPNFILSCKKQLPKFGH